MELITTLIDQSVAWHKDAYIMPCILYMLWEVTSDMREVTFRQIRVYLLGYVEYFFVFGSHDKFFSFSTKILKTSETDGSPHKCVSPRGWYPERDLNPHDRNWPREFKSLVSTDSTIWATARHAAYDETTTPPRDKGTEKRDESLVVRDSPPLFRKFRPHSTILL